MKTIDVSKLTQNQLNTYFGVSVQQDDGMAFSWLEAGADVNSRFDGNTGLVYAIQNRNEELASKLVEAGADVNVRDAHGEPILFQALDNVKWLNILDKGNLDVNAKNYFGENAFSVAYQNGKKAVADKLIELGIKVEESIVNGGMPIGVVSVPILHATITHKKYEWLDRLIGLKVDLDVRRKGNGNTALMDAVNNDDEEVSIKLIVAGADVNLKNSNGKTALMLALRYTIAEKLVENGAKINVADEYGYTPLMHCLEFADDKRYEKDVVKICELLLDRGADVNALADDAETTALDIARDSGNKQVIKLIERYMEK